MSIAELPRRFNAADLDADELYEMIEGVRVEIPPMSTYATLVANNISHAIAAHVAAKILGWCVVETLFRLPLTPERSRRPDVAFVSTSRWPADRPFSVTENAWEVAPDLAIEVVSPTDRVEELTDKLFDYFAAGVRCVWIIHPFQKFIEVYDTLKSCRGLTAEDELGGGDILPGFRINVGSLFPPRK